MLRCIYCGMCEEACPVDAIALTDHNYEVAESRAEKIYTKERLVANNRYYHRGARRDEAMLGLVESGRGRPHRPDLAIDSEPDPGNP